MPPTLKQSKPKPAAARPVGILLEHNCEREYRPYGAAEEEEGFVECGGEPLGFAEATF